jgi:DNA invertase Pin-like site-specific DNA recombinase
MYKTDALYVAYLRVSTQRQGYSGLGLEAQRQIIQNYLSDTKPIFEYVEVESGRKTDKGRPKLKEALSQCRTYGAKLIVAKLDRLARNVSFLSALLESDVEIVFCDFPQANKMVLHILASISQYEAELISTRTKQALAAKKARGCKLGNPEHLLGKHEAAIENSNKTNRKKAEDNPNNKRAVAMLRILAEQGMTLTEMTDKLNKEGFVTSKGYEFRPSQVYVLLKRYNIKY